MDAPRALVFRPLVKGNEIELELYSPGLFGIFILLYRGIEWSLRALASMRAERLFLRARAVIKYVLRAASTLKLIQIMSSEHFVNFLGGI